MKTWKKWVLSLLIWIVIFSILIGCGASVEQKEDAKTKVSMFVIIEETGIYYVVYHKDTKVMYTVSHGGYNSGNFTLLVNQDGTPLLYKD